MVILGILTRSIILSIGNKAKRAHEKQITGMASCTKGWARGGLAGVVCLERSPGLISFFLLSFHFFLLPSCHHSPMAPTSHISLAPLPPFLILLPASCAPFFFPHLASPPVTVFLLIRSSDNITSHMTPSPGILYFLLSFKVKWISGFTSNSRARIRSVNSTVGAQLTQLLMACWQIGT